MRCIPALTSIDNAGHYTPFIQALSAELKPRNKLLTSATASYEGRQSLRYLQRQTHLAREDAPGLTRGRGGDDLGVSQDVAGEHNLLNIIDDEIQRYKTERSSRTQ